MSSIERTFVIAEAGSTHDNDLERARLLIDVAARCGADACKFQFWSSVARLAERRHASAYEAVYTRYAMPTYWLPRLKEHCDGRGIEFMCTVYLPEDIAVVAPYVKRFKVASFEAGDHDFVRAHQLYGKPILVSTGMHEGDHYFQAYPALYIVLLHCVSSYPAPENELGLAVLRTQLDLDTGRYRPSMYQGLSDHTRHPWTGALAVAAGATILERHLRLDDTDPANPDFEVASEPALFAEYVANVRLAERMLGDGVKRQMPSEAAMAKYRVRHVSDLP